jgi:hypothetical protein
MASILLEISQRLRNQEMLMERDLLKAGFLLSHLDNLRKVSDWLIRGWTGLKTFIRNQV